MPHAESNYAGTAADAQSQLVAERAKTGEVTDKIERLQKAFQPIVRTCAAIPQEFDQQAARLDVSQSQAAGNLTQIMGRLRLITRGLELLRHGYVRIRGERQWVMERAIADAGAAGAGDAAAGAETETYRIEGAVIGGREAFSLSIARPGRDAETLFSALLSDRNEVQLSFPQILSTCSLNMGASESDFACRPFHVAGGSPIDIAAWNVAFFPARDDFTASFRGRIGSPTIEFWLSYDSTAGFRSGADAP